MKKYRIVKGGRLWWAIRTVKQLVAPATVMAMGIAAVVIWTGIGAAWE